MTSSEGTCPMRAEGLTRVKAAAFGVVRRGPRTVLWTPRQVNLGNLLYYWLNAHLHQARGEQRLALETERSVPWRAAFPDLFDALVVPRTEVRVRDRRLEQHPLQHYGADFTAGELDAFIREMLLGTSNALLPLIADAAGSGSAGDLTVNVRRGDYYSVPRWRGEYSFDVVEYVRVAIAEVQASAPITTIRLISDDLDWCRIKLRWLSEIAPVSEPAPGTPPLQQLALLATSPRLILTNSTFGYWGGYLADVLRADAAGARGAVPQRPTGTWAPAFHSRATPGGTANQLSPRWNVISEIPGGWDG